MTQGQQELDTNKLLSRVRCQLISLYMMALPTELRRPKRFGYSNFIVLHNPLAGTPREPQKKRKERREDAMLGIC